jgi:3-methyladenine DNA glycosylase AlkC
MRTQNLLFEEGQEQIVQVEPEENNEAIEKPYDPQLIDIRPQTLALFNIIRRLREDAIDLYPDFQRSANLWTPRQQSLLIESILIRIPLPAFYFDGTNNRWQVIDGLQRLCTIKNFVVLQTLKLTNLEYLNQFEGCSFAKLPQHLQRQIEETNIMAYIMNLGAPDVKYNIFKRINTGGVILNPQEIRNALNQGVPVDFVAELASTDSFKQVAKISTKRMQDREFVTRFITFYLNKPEEYKPDLDVFMSNAMGKLAALSEEERYVIKQNFIESMCLASEIFGKWAFRKVYDKNEKRLYPLNKALFEVWSILLAKLSDTERQIIQKVKENIFNDYIKLINKDSNFVGAITSQTGNKGKIIYRFSKIEQLLKNRLS